MRTADEIHNSVGVEPSILANHLAVKFGNAVGTKQEKLVVPNLAFDQQRFIELLTADGTSFGVQIFRWLALLDNQFKSKRGNKENSCDEKGSKDGDGHLLEFDAYRNAIAQGNDGRENIGH